MLSNPAQTLTGLPLVNRELSTRFLPQFLKGLAIGTIMVIASLILVFRDWRLCALALLPTFAGLVWTAGVLALAECRARPVRRVCSRHVRWHRCRLRHSHGPPLSRATRPCPGYFRRACACHPRGGRHHAVRLWNPHHVFVSPTAIHWHSSQRSACARSRWHRSSCCRR